MPDSSPRLPVKVKDGFSGIGAEEHSLVTQADKALTPAPDDPLIKLVTGGRTPLHWAASYNSLDVARLLIDRGAEVDARDEDGRTPLHYAARPSCLDVARLLIEHGANTDGIDLSWIPD